MAQVLASVCFYLLSSLPFSFDCFCLFFLSVQSNLADFIAIGFHGEPQKGSQRKSGSSAVGFCKDGFPGHRECMFSFQYPSCLDFEPFVLLAEMFGY
jgi:hypothetical protein